MRSASPNCRPLIRRLRPLVKSCCVSRRMAVAPLFRIRPVLLHPQLLPRPIQRPISTPSSWKILPQAEHRIRDARASGIQSIFRMIILPLSVGRTVRSVRLLWGERTPGKPGGSAEWSEQFDCIQSEEGRRAGTCPPRRKPRARSTGFARWLSIAVRAKSRNWAISKRREIKQLEILLGTKGATMKDVCSHCAQITAEDARYRAQRGPDRPAGVGTSQRHPCFRIG